MKDMLLPRIVFAIPFLFLNSLTAQTDANAQTGSAADRVDGQAAVFNLHLQGKLELTAAELLGGLRSWNGQWLLLGGGIDGGTGRVSTEGIIARRTADGWETLAVTLPEPVAWAALAADGDSLLVIGGKRTEETSASVSRWRLEGDQLVSESLPPLPEPLMMAGAAVLDNTLHVMGGMSPQGRNPFLWKLNLADTESGWVRDELPEAAIGWMQPLLQVRRDENQLKNVLIAFGGWQVKDAADLVSTNMQPQPLALKIGNADGSITHLATPEPGLLLEAAGTIGPAHILVAARPVETVAQSSTTFPSLASRSVLLRYHIFTNTWARFGGDLPGDVSLIAGLEKRDLLMVTTPTGAAASHLQTARIEAVERHFSWLDYAVMVLYMLGLVAIGKYFASREKSTEDFFLGGRKVPWWAAGLSIYATGTSAISFMAIPAKTYSTDWLYFIGMSIFPFFTMLIAAYLFVPMLRRLEITTVMEYFELRFGRPIRFLMSAIAVLGQVAGRMSITLLLPSIALSAVTGMNIYLSILFMGVLATLYTAAGGISAVIWTDVLQVVVLFGGALLSFGLILARVDGGFGSMITLAVIDDKFNFFDLRWDFTTATLWVMVLWAVADVFGKGLGQEGLQRAFSTKGVKEARRSMLTCAVVALPAGVLFYGIGTALYAFYKSHPALLNPALQTDAIFPLFIAQQLPAGLAGLVIAGLFAASMSTLDTAMNTCATITVRDFYSVWRKNTGEKERLLMARVVTILCGIVGTGIALYMASFENLGSLWDMFSILLGVIGGGLGGVGVLALCTTRASTYGTLAGAMVTAISMILIQRYTPVHFFIYGTISMALGGTTGYLLSLLLPERQPKDLTGLTLWTQRKDSDA